MAEGVGAALSLLHSVGSIIASVEGRVNQMSLNSNAATDCCLKIKFLSQKITNLKSKFDSNVCLHEDSNLQLLLERINEILSRIELKLDKICKKNRFQQLLASNKIKTSFENIFLKLKDEVEPHIQEFVEEMDKILTRSSTLTLVANANRFPQPKSVVEVSAEPNGEFLRVRWKDVMNESTTISAYHIYVDDRYLGSYNPTAEGTDSDEDSVYVVSIQNSDTLIGWTQHSVQVCAANRAGQQGPKSTHVPVIMNQHPPTVKPSAVKLNALSKSTVQLSFDYPKGFRTMGIAECHVTGRVDSDIYTDSKNILSSSATDKGYIVLENIDATKTHELFLSFTNKYGEGKRCERPISFKIEELEPQGLILERESSTHTSIAVKCDVQVHAGAVKHYNLFMSLSKKEWIRIASFKADSYEVSNLETDKTYFFYAEACYAEAKKLTSNRIEAILLNK